MLKVKWLWSVLTFSAICFDNKISYFTLLQRPQDPLFLFENNICIYSVLVGWLEWVGCVGIIICGLLIVPTRMCGTFERGAGFCVCDCVWFCVWENWVVFMTRFLWLFNLTRKIQSYCWKARLHQARSKHAGPVETVDRMYDGHIFDYPHITQPTRRTRFTLGRFFFSSFFLLLREKTVNRTISLMDIYWFTVTQSILFAPNNNIRILDRNAFEPAQHWIPEKTQYPRNG